MRFALLGPTYPFRGGISHYTTMLAQALGNRGHDVFLVSFKRLYPGWLFPGESDRDPSCEPLVADNAKYWIDSLNPVTWFQTFFRLSHYKPDLIVLPWWTLFLSPAWFVIASLSRAFLRVPLVFICHNVLPHEPRPWDRWAARAVLRRGTGFIVQSDSERDALLHSVPKADPVVVPHPVYDMFARVSMPRAAARQAIGVSDEIPVLLFFGLVREYKGLMDLLEAMPQIRRQLGRVLLVIAGEFWEPRELYDQRISELGVLDCVRIDDHYIPNEEVPQYFRAADLVVAPYRRVTGSGVAQMAIGFGVPLLTTSAPHFDGPDLPSFLMIVPPGDSCAIAERVVSHFSTPLSDDSRSEIQNLQSVFSWEKLVLALERFAWTEGAGR